MDYSKEEAEDPQQLMKNKRDQFSYEIRKKKNDATLNAKRMKYSGKSITQQNTTNDANYFKNLGANFEIAMRENDIAKLEKALEEIRDAFFSVDNPYIDPLLELNILPRIANFLSTEFLQYTKVQHEAAWIVANVASTKYTKYAVEELRAIDRLIAVLPSPSEEVKEMVVWGIANIAGDSREYAEHLLSKDIINLIINLVENEASSNEILRNVTWCLSNLTQGTPYPPFEHVAAALPLLERLFVCNDEEVLSNVLYAISHIAAANEENIECIIEMDCIKQIINLAMCEGKDNATLRTPALEIIGNILANEEDIYAQDLINMNVIKCIAHNLNSKTRIWRKSALWHLSNVFACGTDAIYEVFKDEKIFPRLCELFYNDSNDIKSEVIQCLFKASKEGAFHQIEYMVDNDVVKVLLDALQTETDKTIILNALSALDYILATGKSKAEGEGGGPNTYLQQLEHDDGLKVIQSLLNKGDEEIFAQASALSDEYFIYD